MQSKPKINIKVLTLVLAVVAAIAGLATLNHYMTTQVVRFEFDNVTEVAVFGNTSPGENATPIASVSNSGDSLRLKKNASFSLSYEAADGYAPGSMEFTTNSGDEKTVTIEPHLSEERLDAMLDDELSAIHAALKEAYSGIIGAYDISRGRLFHFGDWYGTTLIYQGSDIFNSDTLRAVLQKDESGEWAVATEPPTISLSKHVYTDVPVDVLREVNSL